MDRREALKRVSVLFGGALYAPAVAGILSGCRTGGSAGYTPRTLAPGQHELVAQIAERIIPETDTPGARTAGVQDFIDLLLTEWAPDDDRARFLKGLTELDAESRTKYGAAFTGATADQQVAMLTRLDTEAQAAIEAGASTAITYEYGWSDDLPFFGLMKQLTLLGYYTSEIGATQELQWLAIPVYFDGCAPLADVGRAWA